VQSLPKYTPNSLTRAVKSEAVPYTEVANRYTGKTSTPDLAAIVAKHQAEFQAVRSCSYPSSASLSRHAMMIGLPTCLEFP